MSANISCLYCSFDATEENCQLILLSLYILHKVLPNQLDVKEMNSAVTENLNVPPR